MRVPAADVGADADDGLLDRASIEVAPFGDDRIAHGAIRQAGARAETAAACKSAGADRRS